MHGTLDLVHALEMVKAAGYKISSPRAAKAKTAPALNCLGLPMSPSFDPNYRMKYRTPPIKHGGQSIGLGVTPERWTEMCQEAHAAWVARLDN